ncbi:YlbF family regulator [Marinicrinis lubricantis]|uniref:YlbF family regulator n=1 Tax=Marinicrinis lubricantis TaxID=2086470 RepID=A0ABW1IMP9_9BACL
MSVSEAKMLDMSKVLLLSYELADMIHHSKELSEYLYWKDVVLSNEEIQKVVAELSKAKESFAECERFGHYHPNYHEGLEKVKQVESKLDSFEEVKRFKECENRLDELLYDISKTIAHSVSDNIKVPTNQLIPESGCGSGGACSGNCG